MGISKSKRCLMRHGRANMLWTHAVRPHRKVAWHQHRTEAGAMQHWAGKTQCTASAVSASKPGTMGTAGMASAEETLHRVAHCGVAGGM